jgi:transcription-repair coupling factor (superfamily II helicase)
MRDLEIRGAGNLLGAQQHGHMDSVGYDMYCKLLSDAVNELKGEPVKERFETLIDINADAYIPATYIQNEQQRLEMYKKISLVQTLADFNDVQEEMEDRYGNPPRPVNNLLDVALLKGTAHNMGVVSITERKSGGQMTAFQYSYVITFRADASVDVDKLTAAIAGDPSRLRLTMTPAPHLTFRHNIEDNMEAIRLTKGLLEGLR